MSNRLYVGNLAFHVTEDLLRQKFTSAGEVASVSVMQDRETGRSRGFGFVEMSTAEGAQKALSELNGTDLEGRSLRVDVAEELSRLEIHVAELLRIVDGGGQVGKRLDFLMQELNREANTLGSKAAGMEVTQASVELKLLIEQVREQVQNLE